MIQLRSTKNLQIRSVQDIRHARAEENEALDSNVQGRESENDVNKRLGPFVMAGDPHLIDSERDCDDGEYVREQTGKAVHDFDEDWFGESLQLKAELGENSAHRRHDGQQISRQAEQRVCRLIMFLSEVVLVNEDAGLSNRDENQRRRLQNPVNRHAILVVQGLRQEVVVGHAQYCVGHQNQVLKYENSYSDDDYQLA